MVFATQEVSHFKPNIMKATEGIDWKLLGQQKLTLAKLLNERKTINYLLFTDEVTKDLDGILNLLDEMTDENYHQEEEKKEEVTECCEAEAKFAMIDLDGTNLEEGYECSDCGEINPTIIRI